MVALSQVRPCRIISLSGPSFSGSVFLSQTFCQVCSFVILPFLRFVLPNIRSSSDWTVQRFSLFKIHSFRIYPFSDTQGSITELRFPVFDYFYFLSFKRSLFLRIVPSEIHSLTDSLPLRLVSSQVRPFSSSFLLRIGLSRVSTF